MAGFDCMNNMCRCHYFKFTGNDINSRLETIRSAIHQEGCYVKLEIGNEMKEAVGCRR